MFNYKKFCAFFASLGLIINVLNCNNVEILRKTQDVRRAKIINLLETELKNNYSATNKELGGASNLDTLTLSEFVKGALDKGVKYEGTSDLIKRLNNNVGFLNKLLNQVKKLFKFENKSSFELLLLEKLRDLNLNVLNYYKNSDSDSGKTLILKQQWIDFLALIDDYLANKQPSKIFKYVVRPVGYLVYYPLYDFVSRVGCSMSKILDKAIDWTLGMATTGITALFIVCTIRAFYSNNFGEGFIKGVQEVSYIIKIGSSVLFNNIISRVLFPTADVAATSKVNSLVASEAEVMAKNPDIVLGHEFYQDTVLPVINYLSSWIAS